MGMVGKDEARQALSRRGEVSAPFPDGWLLLRYVIWTCEESA